MCGASTLNGGLAALSLTVHLQVWPSKLRKRRCGANPFHVDGFGELAIDSLCFLLVALVARRCTVRHAGAFGDTRDA